MSLLEAGKCQKCLSGSCLFVGSNEHLVYCGSQTKLSSTLGEWEGCTFLFSYFPVHQWRSWETAHEAPCVPAAQPSWPDSALHPPLLFYSGFFLSCGLNQPAQALRMNSIRKHTGEEGKRILAKSQNGNNNTEIGMEHPPISPGCWEN